MKLYSPEAGVRPASPYPSEPVNHDSLEAAREYYQAFIWECERFGQTPLDLWLYIGTAQGDEGKYGYPDWPDYILKAGPRGGVTHHRS